MTEAPTQRPRKEMTKNGRGVSAKLTESEYKEWVKLGKGKWLRSFLKDSRFQREMKT
jgi:predicted nucleic acid-binding Zn finger protein